MTHRTGCLPALAALAAAPTPITAQGPDTVAALSCGYRIERELDRGGMATVLHTLKYQR